MVQTYVTVLVPCKDPKPSFFRETLLSVFNQSDQRWHLLVIDDHCQNATILEILAELNQRPSSKIRVIKSQGRHITGALNTGMKAAKTAFVCSLHCDDLLPDSALEILNGYIVENPEVDYFHSSRRIVDEQGKFLSDVLTAQETFSLSDFKDWGPIKHLHCWRVAAALSMGGMDETLGPHGSDDYDFSWCMAEAGCTFKAVRECLYHYRDHRSHFRLTTHVPRDIQINELQKIWQKHGLSDGEIHRQIKKRTDGYLKQALYLDDEDKIRKQNQGYDIKSGWREKYHKPLRIAGNSLMSQNTYRPKVSIIVPVYNAEATIDQCMISLLELNYPVAQREIIVVDNMSTDGTKRILQHYSSQITILQEAKRGPAAARNRGASRAQGEIVAFTDADCIVERNWLEKIVQPLKNHDIGFVGGRILARDTDNFIAKFGEKIHDHEQAITMYQPPYIITMNSALRLSVFQEVGLFNERLLRSEDVDLAYRIQQQGYTFVYQPAAIIYHKNETTLYGLFAEGFLHGRYAPPLYHIHASFLQQYGYRLSWQDTMRKLSPPHSLSYFEDRIGKKPSVLLFSTWEKRSDL